MHKSNIFETNGRIWSQYTVKATLIYMDLEHKYLDNHGLSDQDQNQDKIQIKSGNTETVIFDMLVFTYRPYQIDPHEKQIQKL